MGGNNKRQFRLKIKMKIEKNKIKRASQESSNHFSLRSLNSVHVYNSSRFSTEKCLQKICDPLLCLRKLIDLANYLLLTLKNKKQSVCEYWIWHLFEEENKCTPTHICRQETNLYTMTDIICHLTFDKRKNNFPPFSNGSHRKIICKQFWAKASSKSGKYNNCTTIIQRERELNELLKLTTPSQYRTQLWMSDNNTNPKM